jgi:hypothetical protein
MALCIIDFIGGNGLLGRVGGRIIGQKIVITVFYSATRKEVGCKLVSIDTVYSR